ncbi:hypothetical protein [Phytohabitans kaempferiae]|uniref:DNA primase n=1 Tax=Phytohabitans kaempferiae TaxID=1620943 RepID=A0ABV6MG10_9ACTN
MNRTTQIALAAGAGYVLGRRRNLRLALVLGSAVAAGRLSRDPRTLVRQGAKMLGGSGELGKLAGLGAPLVAATKAAATNAVTRRVDSVSAGLRQRADLLREPSRAAPDDVSDESDESTDDSAQPRRQTRAGTRRRGGPGRRGRTSEPDDAEADDTEPDDLADDDADDLGYEEPEAEADEDGDAEADLDDEDPDDLEDEPPAPRRQARRASAAAPVRRRGR